MHQFKLFVGPMFGGKTTRMLSHLDRYQYQGADILLFKPNVDDRYENGGEAEVISHTGVKQQAIKVDHGHSIQRVVSAIYGTTPSVIAIDEAFMIPGSGEAAVQLFKMGHTILVSSLQLASDGTPFEEIVEMFPWATHVEVCPAVDPVSKFDAYYTEKIGGTQASGTVEVGGADMYRPRDWQGFFGSDR
jgi:thymidine kinase